MTTDADFIKVRCGCGKKIKVPAGALGRKARCPVCSDVVLITEDRAVTSASSAEAPRQATASFNAVVQPRAAAAPRRSSALQPMQRTVVAPPAQADEPAPDLDDFDALYQAASQADDAPAEQGESRCPQCASPMAGGAVFCTACGYDAAARKTAAIADASKARPLPAQRIASGGKSQTGLSRSVTLVTKSIVIFLSLLTLLFSYVVLRLAVVFWNKMATQTTGDPKGYLIIALFAILGVAALICAIRWIIRAVIAIKSAMKSD